MFSFVDERCGDSAYVTDSTALVPRKYMLSRAINDCSSSKAENYRRTSVVAEIGNCVSTSLRAAQFRYPSIIIMEEERQKLYGHIAGMSRLMRTLQEEENVARRSKGNNAYRKKAEFMKSRSPSASGFMNETRRGGKERHGAPTGLVKCIQR